MNWYNIFFIITLSTLTCFAADDESLNTIDAMAEDFLRNPLTALNKKNIEKFDTAINTIIQQKPDLIIEESNLFHAVALTGNSKGLKELQKTDVKYLAYQTDAYRHRPLYYALWTYNELYKKQAVTLDVQEKSFLTQRLQDTLECINILESLTPEDTYVEREEDGIIFVLAQYVGSITNNWIAAEKIYSKLNNILNIELEYLIYFDKYDDPREKFLFFAATHLYNNEGLKKIIEVNPAIINKSFEIKLLTGQEVSRSMLKMFLYSINDIGKPPFIKEEVINEIIDLLSHNKTLDAEEQKLLVSYRMQQLNNNLASLALAVKN